MELGKVFDGPWNKTFDPADVQLRNAIAQAGIKPPASIHLDGQIHRFSTAEHGQDDAGWYVGFPDGIPAGRFGDWRTGIEQTWTAQIDRDLTSSERLEAARRIEEARLRHQEERRRRNEQAAETVAKIWRDATPATNDHPYLARKGIAPNGARVGGDGRLLVPLFDQSGKLSTLQYIDADGEKRYHPGGATKGCYFIFGEIKDKLYIAEGFATAATIWEETGTPTVAAYSAGNLSPTTEALRALHPTASIILVADNDATGVGQNHAEQAAAKFGATVIVPPSPGDVNDYRLSGGDIKTFLEPVKKSWLVPIDDWCNQPAPIKWLVRGWIQDKALCMIHGPSGGGKTFAVLDIALHMATEKPEWQGHKIHGGSIVYLAGEGHHGLRARVAAWCQENHEKPRNMHVSQSAIDLNTPQGTQQTIEHIRELNQAPRMVIVDTLHRFMAGDENSAQDAKTMIDACARIQQEFDCTVLLVHHTGVSDAAKNRARGSSSWRGAMENEISVINTDGTLEIKAEKIKDAEKPEPKSLALQSVDIAGWIDEDGEQVKSAILTQSDKVQKVQKKDKKVQEAEKIVEKAWFHTGMEVNKDGNPYISIAGFVRWFEECTDKTAGTIKNEMKPSVEGRFINLALKNSILEKEIHGYQVIDDAIVSKLLLSKNI